MAKLHSAKNTLRQHPVTRKLTAQKSKPMAGVN